MARPDMVAAPKLVPQEPAPSPKYPVIWDDELEQLPAPEWDIDDVLPHNGLVMIYGAPGCGKSFIMLDIAASLGLGLPWQGRRCRRGNVVYIYSEGHGGLRARVEAWRTARRLSRRRLGIAFVPKTIQLMALSESIIPLAQAIELACAEPAAIIIDTLQRNAAGAEENSAKEMGLALASCDFLRVRLGCTVVVVHHTRRGDDAFRGSAVLLGTPDTVISVKREGSSLTMKCEKQKDAEEFEPIALSLAKAGESCVITSGTAIGEGCSLAPLQLAVLQCLADISESSGCSNSKWEEAATEDRKVSVRTYYSAKKTLLLKGYACQLHGTKRFTVTPSGLRLLQLQGYCNGAATAAEPLTATSEGAYRAPVAAVAGEQFVPGDAYEGDL